MIKNIASFIDKLTFLHDIAYKIKFAVIKTVF